MREGGYGLLLVGGTWTQWLELHEAVLSYPILPLVTHVGPGRPSDWAHYLVRQASRVVLMAPGDESGQDSDLGEAPSCPIWPFVLAALSGAGLYMPSSNAHLLQLSREASNGWGAAHLDNGARTLVSKLHGLGSAYSRVVVKTLATTQSVPFLTSAPASAQASTCTTRESRNVTAIVGLELESFVLGRDGQCCFFHAGRRLQCLIRLDKPYVTVRIEVPEPDPVCAAQPSFARDEVVELEVKLRGNLFADFVHNTSVLVPITRAAFKAQHLTREEQIKFDNIATQVLHPFVTTKLNQ
jgi:hypothetical protein